VGHYGVATPGSISWVTTGASTYTILGNHTTSTRSGGLTVGGGLGEWLGSLDVDSKKDVSKKVTGLMKSTTSGAVNVKASGEYKLGAKTTLTLKVTGNLELGGSPITFKCGDSEISASSSGVKIKSSSIKFNGDNNQTGSLTHK
jgi:type VI secretion system secreted protein VgrG